MTVFTHGPTPSGVWVVFGVVYAIGFAALAIGVWGCVTRIRRKR